MSVKLALLGCGHIGGSLALALRRAGAVGEVAGYDVSPAAARAAVELGICARVAGSAAEAVADAGVVVIAVPVRAIGELARAVAGAVGEGAVVTDVGSTKAGVVREAEAALGARFVGGHPLAGTERAGAAAADAGLFAGRTCVLTPTPATGAAALAAVRELWRAAGAHVIDMDAGDHDRVMAAVSHLPHVAAYALAGTLGQVGEGGRAYAGLAGGGFTDTTRIASTPPAMWIDVFLENRAALLALIDAFGARLGELRAAIDAGDAAAIERLLGEAREARARILAR